VSIHKDCGAQVRWAHRDDEPNRWLPPLDHAGQAYIITEDDAAVLVNTYKIHQCDPDQMEAWQAYKEKLAEIQARKGAEPVNMTTWEVRREQLREEAWLKAFKRKCPRCGAAKNVKCHKLTQRLVNEGITEYCLNPHPERLEE